MEMKLYQTLDDENVINKTIELKHTIPIKMKDRNSINSPSIVLSNHNKEYDFTVCNYAYLDVFNRFYFIRDIVILDNIKVSLSLECDVLESFKKDILNSNAEISRSIKQGDFISIGGVTDLRKEIDIYESDVVLINQKNIILSTIGG